VNGYDVHPNYLTRLHRADGYDYQRGKEAANSPVA